jgi:membrane associated rhomboid family serine protease
MITFKMISYPLALCIGAVMVVSFLGMAMFGVRSADWADWQNGLVGSIGTAAGLAGAIVGLWLAIRSERRAIQ